ncbi:MAG TPA: metalloregulator ArsR/SmtB family transcription factor [Chthonomonadales bacterium]|nr:metalloregulator ArsR/SmtB family transcription factor [Chthonomonadales bacterium]
MTLSCGDAILNYMVKYSEEDLDGVFSALSDPTRRQVAEALTEGEKSLTDLARPFRMTMPAVMKHIAVMEHSGILRTEKRGRSRYCRLEPARLVDAQTWLARTSGMWKDRLAALDRYLKENP